MDIKKLPINIDSVEKIFHLADIHIRLFKRNNEYREVFQNLYEEIKKEKTENSIIVVAGDIFHSKGEMTPESVLLASDFFKKLSSILPTIVTAGNHDANLNNKSRLDAIYPIVRALNIKDLYYLKDTGLYQVGNTVFSVMSIFDKMENYIKADEIDSNLIKIAIFHGAIYNSITDTNWKIKDEKIKTNMFDGYDIVLLGDIHRHQMLQPYTVVNGIKKPCMAFPSSLIQQHFGESIDMHGILIWDVNSRTFEFRRIKNDYAYVTVEIENGKIISDISNLPSKLKIKTLVKNTSQTELKNCIKEIRDKYDIIEISFGRKSENNEYIEDVQNKLNFGKIMNVDFQNNLLKNYFIKKQYNIDNEKLNKIFEINRELNSLLPTEEIIRNIIWKPKLFKFSNMFSYGEDNVIDFTKMEGLVGLFSSNASGKTSILESLMFCLFDRCSKTFKANNIMNNRKDEFYCELLFEIAGQDYIISRKAKKSPTNQSVSVKVDFYKISKDGNKISLNGEHRKDTDMIIRSYIGTFEDFILTAISSQNNNANFIDKTQTERKDLLTTFMDITVFDKLYDIASDKIKEYQILLKEYKNNDYEKEINESEYKILKYSEEIKKLENDRNSILKEKSVLEESMLSLAKDLIPIDNSIVDIDSLIKNKNYNIKQIEIYKNELDSIKNEILEVNFNYNKIKKSIEKHIDSNIEEQYSVLINKKKELELLNSDIEKFKVHLSHKLEKTQKLRELEYDPNCKYCMNNIFVKDAIEAKKELEKDKELAKEMGRKKSIISNQIEKILYIESEYKDYNNLKNELEKTEIKLSKLENRKNSIENNIKQIDLQLSDLKNKIDLYYKSEENIKKNKIIEDKISSIKKNISEILEELSTLENKITITNSNILYQKQIKEKAINSLNKFKEMEDKNILYQYYLDAMHRDSIPYDLTSDIIPLIEKEINDILSQIVSFSIILELDGKNINVKIAYDEERIWPLEMASGMERFISGLAIRIALISVTSLPKPNFLAIDEGFSSLDADNSSNLPMVFDYFKNKFDFIFIISHMDYIRDFVDISLDLKNENGFSKIEFI